MNITAFAKQLLIGPLAFASIGTALGAPFDQSKIDQGLIVWQEMPDSRGRTCADCHGAPDAFDLAYFNFTDADLRRRGTPNHIGTVDTEKIVDLVRELRKKYDIVSPKDARTTRVFQPGGAPLAGANPTERDAAFLQTLQTKLPMLATGTVDTYAKAVTAATELKNYDMRTERNGILFPLWSEDLLFGAAHGRITDWIADEGLIPTSSAGSAAIKTARAAYLANPNETNFWQMYSVISENADVRSTVTDSNQRDHWRDKYMNSLIGSHDLRMLQTGQPLIMDKSNTRHTHLNTARSSSFEFPAWGLGDQAREVGEFSAEIRSSLDPSISDSDHVALGKDAWWWVGFMYNNSFEHEPERQEYFPNSLAENIWFRRIDQGPGFYTAHSLFTRAKSDIAAALQPFPTVAGDVPYYGNIGRTNPVSPFNCAPAVGLSVPLNPDEEPERWFNATHKAQYMKLALNISKMRLQLIKKRYEDAIASKTQLGEIRFDENPKESTDWIDYRNVIVQYNKWDAANATANTSLYNSFMSLREQAKRAERVPVVGTGNGLNGVYFNSTNFTNQVATRVDQKIDFDNGPAFFGGTNGAIYPTANNELSVRWTGFYQPKYTDTYTFWAFMSGDLFDIPLVYPQPNQGACRIWVNNELVFDMTQPNFTGNINQGIQANPNVYFPTVSLEAGKSYPITVEYAQTGAYQRMVLLETSSRQSLNPIPKSQLYTTLPAQGKPAAPNNLAFEKLGGQTVRVSWTDYSYNETNFVLQRKTGTSGTWANVGTVGTDVLSYDNTGLTSSVGYFYRVKATNSAGSSAYSTAAYFSYNTDDLNDWSKTNSRTANWSIGAPDANWANGDALVAGRSSDTTESITWRANALDKYKFNIYYNSFFDTSKVKVYVSNNGTTFNNHVFTAGQATATINGWQYIELTPGTSVPAGTNYVRIEFQTNTSGTGRPWSPAVSSATFTTTKAP